MHNAPKKYEFNITPNLAGQFVIRRGNEVIYATRDIIVAKDAEFYIDEEAQDVFKELAQVRGQCGWLLCSAYEIVDKDSEKAKLLQEEFKTKVIFTVHGGFQRSDNNKTVSKEDKVLMVPSHALVA